jgi:protein gp37
VKGGVQKLLTIQRKAHEFRDEHGHWPRVFCSSLSDVFDNAVDKSWQIEAFATIHACPDTRVMLLTKRVGNVFAMIPPSWASPELGGWPAHVGLMITVVNQAEADQDIPKLLDLKARLRIPWVGLSMEPLLGPVELTHMDVQRHPSAKNLSPIGAYFINALTGRNDDMGRPCPDVPCLDWIIVGGESGHHARPVHPDWARSLRDQCVAAGVPCLFKQWGEWAPTERSDEIDQKITMPGQNRNLWAWPDGVTKDSWRTGPVSARVGTARAGRLLDGRTWDQFPEALT